MARHNVREQIVEAGLATMLEKGFNGCGVKDITDVAGVPKGSFYNHFESKEALGAEIVERYGVGNPRAAALVDRSIPALARLRQYFEGLNELLAQQQYERGCLLGNLSAEMADHSPLIRAKLAALFANWTRGLEGALRDAQAEGSIAATHDPAVLAGFLLDAYEGALLRARVERSGHALDRFMTVAFSQMLT